MKTGSGGLELIASKALVPVVVFERGDFGVQAALDLLVVVGVEFAADLAHAERVVDSEMQAGLVALLFGTFNTVVGGYLADAFVEATAELFGRARGGVGSDVGFVVERAEANGVVGVPVTDANASA